MQMKLTELQAQTLEWLDDPAGQIFVGDTKRTRLNGLIHLAYQHLVNELDSSHQPWNALPEASATTVTVVTTTREYNVGPGRLVSEVFEYRDTNRQLALTIVPYSKRNELRPGGDVYVFRSALADGDWYVGMVQMPTSLVSLRVHVLPVVAKLTGNESIPVALPAQFHELIVLKAAMLGQMQEKRDTTQIAALYAEGLNLMKRRASTTHGAHSARRMG